MNIAFFLKPKHEVAFLYEDQSLRQGLEKMKHHGYSAIPVITRESKYIGTVSEGDFLRYLLREEGRITQTAEELLLQAMSQNFIPVVDDFDSFIGIVTRKDILSYFYREMVHPQETS